MSCTCFALVVPKYLSQEDWLFIRAEGLFFSSSGFFGVEAFLEVVDWIAASTGRDIFCRISEGSEFEGNTSGDLGLSSRIIWSLSMQISAASQGLTQVGIWVGISEGAICPSKGKAGEEEQEEDSPACSLGFGLDCCGFPERWSDSMSFSFVNSAWPSASRVLFPTSLNNSWWRLTMVLSLCLSLTFSCSNCCSRRAQASFSLWCRSRVAEIRSLTCAKSLWSSCNAPRMYLTWLL